MRNPELDAPAHAWLGLSPNLVYGIIAGVMLAILICKMAAGA